MTRHHDPAFDQRVADWLETDPDRAPGQVLDTVVAALPSIPQRRALRTLWRFPAMNRLTLIGSAAAAIVVIVVGGIALLPRGGTGPGAGVSPSPSIPATASPSPHITNPPGPDYTGLPGWIVFEHFGQAPDGSTTTMDTDRRQIWLVHADGSGLHELAPGQPVDGKYAPDISPDGSTVAFNAWDNHIQVWTARIEGGAPELISTDCSGKPDECMEAEPAYSSDGRRLAFVRAVAGDVPSSVIGIRDLTTGAVTLLEATRSEDAVGSQTQPTWSPDGAQILFSRVRRDATGAAITSRIFRVQADGTGLTELDLPAETPWGDPDWSPDGSRLVLTSYPIHDFNVGDVDIYTSRPDGSDLTQVSSLACGGCGAGSWTPDGTHILFWGPTTFYLMDPDGQNAAPINNPKLTFFGEELGYGYYAYLQPTP
jgi:Tol biopolymer transport system component